MWNYGYNSMMGWGGLGWISMIFWWFLIVAGIVLLIKWFTNESHRDSRNKEKTPLDILKERYARGEIDKKEFEEKKKDLI